MPLILIVVQTDEQAAFRSESVQAAASSPLNSSSMAKGLMATGGMLYVFLILAGLFCNQFAFEQRGMRTLILSPVDRKTILMGKNIAIIDRGADLFCRLAAG